MADQTSTYRTSGHPRQIRTVTLQLVHDKPIAGHPGRDKTLSLTRQEYYWPTLRVYVEKYVLQCVVCAKHKVFVKRPTPMLQYSVPGAPWEVVNIDLLQLPRANMVRATY